MSLDVYLTIKDAQIENVSSGIFIRENGVTKEITEDEWNAKYPDEEPVRFNSEDIVSDEVYSANITHNLGKMADEAGIYELLWRPDEVGITKAKDLIEPLKEGLLKLKEKPDYFNKFNASNGWGLYKHFVPFVENYLNACIQYPEADVNVSR